MLCGFDGLSSALSAPFPDTPFRQETHERFPPARTGPANDVRAVAVDRDDTVWAATKAGVFSLRQNASAWVFLSSGPAGGAAFDLAAESNGIVWIAAWDGLHRVVNGAVERYGAVTEPVSVLALRGAEVAVAGPDGLWRVDGNRLRFEKLPCGGYVRAMVGDGRGGLWIGSEMGLFYRATGAGARYLQTLDLPSADVRGVAFSPSGELWAVGLGGATVLLDREVIRHIGPPEGLPEAHAQCVARAPDGAMWVGTRGGVARFDGERHSVRHGQRWLLDDDVRDIAFDSAGHAWVGTAGGVSQIRQSKMTLAAKAAHFHEVCEARHVREPGIVEKCRLRIPGDVSSWEPQDDDNDGGYTALYLAMESYRYAVTHDASAQANARRAFAALRFLQTVTGTPGFVARTVIPSSWRRMADPNESLSVAEVAERRVQDPRDKYVPERWRRSADGRWLWKGDTSSDEITAHMFGYFIYYELAADEEERRAVRDQVSRIVDFIVNNGYVLRDMDGRPTRWGVWAPERLNSDPEWAMERGINSVEILSYIKLAHHLTGLKKYEDHYHRLLREHHYQANVLRAKNTDPAWRTHIDDELLAFAYPALVLLEKDPSVARAYRQSLESWHEAVKGDNQPFFEFVYSALTGAKNALDGAMEGLRDTPLDLVRWQTDNTRREDVRLVRFPELEHWQTNRLLPASERSTLRTDENPWLAVQGDGGQTESDGVFWMLPYWMGRHYGFIQGGANEK